MLLMSSSTRLRIVHGLLTAFCLVLLGCGDDSSDQVAGGCSDGAQRCDGGTIMVCQDGAWQAGQICQGGDICVDTSPTTAECVEPGALLVTTHSVGRRLQPSTTPGDLATARLAGARRSVQSFQVLVRGNGGPLQGVTATPGPLTSASGVTLAAQYVTTFRAAFIDFAGVDAIHGALPAPEASTTGDSLVPDPLIPLVDPYTGDPLGQPFSVAADQNEVLFVDVEIPVDASPGTYDGTLVVSTGAESIDVPIELEVWNLTLPDLNAVHTYFGFEEDMIKYYHDGTYDCYSGPDDCWVDYQPRSLTIAGRYADLLHAHRIDPGQFNVPIPEGGCQPPSNWSAYDAAMEPYMDGSFFSDGVPSGRVDVPFTPGEAWDECTQEQYTAQAAAWATHLKQTGWFDEAVVYAVDEPESNGIPLDRIAMHSSWMQTGDPDWKAHIMDTIAAAFPTIDTMEPALGIFCQALAEYSDWSTDSGPYFYGPEEWDELRAAGTQLWFYESNNQGPPYTTFASNSLDGLEPTMMMWGAWYEHATGFLLWGTAAWALDNPWGPNISYGKSGDGVIIYPGNHNGLQAPAGSPDGIELDGPIPSYRLKMIRTGLQDWALFILAEQAGVGDLARQQVHEVYRQLGGCDWEGCPSPEGGFFWNSDEQAMNDIRAAVAQAIISAQQ